MHVEIYPNLNNHNVADQFTLRYYIKKAVGFFFVIIVQGGLYSR